MAPGEDCKNYSQYAYGAHFAEVGVDPRIGARVRDYPITLDKVPPSLMRGAG